MRPIFDALLAEEFMTNQANDVYFIALTLAFRWNLGFGPLLEEKTWVQ